MMRLLKKKKHWESYYNVYDSFTKT